MKPGLACLSHLYVFFTGSCYYYFLLPVKETKSLCWVRNALWRRSESAKFLVLRIQIPVLLYLQETEVHVFPRNLKEAFKTCLTCFIPKTV